MSAGPLAAPAPAPGIAARPDISPEVLAVLAAAVDQAWPRPRVAMVEEPAKPPAWRFSGRWWSRPATTRRDRPSPAR
ncbi:MAG TPA: hypothetical protein VIC86_09255 [Acidimicrobiales bacterium]